jgi:hypoxanthine phosphoribosyltransferase
LKGRPRVLYSPAKIGAQVARMGRAISKDNAGHTLDVVILLENAFVFGADLVRHISVPTVCHFVRAERHNVHFGGFERIEIFFSHEPDLKGRHVLVVDTVLHSGVTMDFLVKRLQETRPRSVSVAVLLDKPHERRVDLQPDYFGLRAASNYMVGYGLPGKQGMYRGLPYIGAPDGGRGPARGKAKGRR